MFVFVYGTLKEGRGNDYLLGDCRKVGEGITKDSFVLTDCGFPYLIKSEYAPGLEANQVRGEVYEINSEVLGSLDCLEGFHEDGAEYNHYNRESIPVILEGNKEITTLVYICNSQEGSREAQLPPCDTEIFMDKKVYVY